MKGSWIHGWSSKAVHVFKTGQGGLKKPEGACKDPYTSPQLRNFFFNSFGPSILRARFPVGCLKETSGETAKCTPDILWTSTNWCKVDFFHDEKGKSETTTKTFPPPDAPFFLEIKKSPDLCGLKWCRISSTHGSDPMECKVSIQPQGPCSQKPKASGGPGVNRGRPGPGSGDCGP